MSATKAIAGGHSAEPPRRRSPLELADDLRAAGIAQGDSLVMHSSFRRLGPIDGGPKDVVEAVLATVGPTGHLMVPTFTYSLPIWKCDPFHHRDSASRVGAITEAVRCHPAAWRSFHPTHSVAVLGPDAESVVENHLHSTPIGAGSPFARMLERGAKILMLGTFQDTDSTLHLAEVLSGVPYVHVTFSEAQSHETAWFINESGATEYVAINEMPGCSRGFRAIEPALVSRGILRRVQIGEADSQLLDARAMVRVAMELLAEQPDLLLCHLTNCAICPKRRRLLKRRGLIR